MKTIVHTCSSVLVRPNGIVRYMNAVMDLQRSLGHRVVFVTDAKPTQKIHADEVLYEYDVSQYVPNMKDGHVWLQVDPNLTHTIHELLVTQCPHVDLVVAHDIHSYLGAVKIYSDGIFVQHETDVLVNGSRYSYLDDDYVDQQKRIAESSPWRIGMTVPHSDIVPQRVAYTPFPFQEAPASEVEKTRDLLYIGDASERKGAREFMEIAKKLKVTPTVITHELDSELFAGADVHRFDLSQRDEMFDLISEHKVAYIPSKNECPGLAILECLQFMPVFVDGNYRWTRNIEDAGALLVPHENMEEEIRAILHGTSNVENPRKKLERWARHARALWVNLTG